LLYSSTRRTQSKRSSEITCNSEHVGTRM